MTETDEEIAESEMIAGSEGSWEVVPWLHDRVITPLRTTVSVPLWSLLGFGALCLWQLQRQHEAQVRQHTELLKLVGQSLELNRDTARGLAVAQVERSTELSKLALERSRDTALVGAVAAGSSIVAATLPLLFLLSDRRLKRNIHGLPCTLGGCPLYIWEWSEDAHSRFGLHGYSCGVLAQEAAELRQDAVYVGADGFLRVSYHTLMTPIA
eukprot:TRINITY_DN11897_c0_g1_i1.p1 TRINITY_DN11897_c0_g1~~TRINITY_DN11897_c0_g1_i1.p1  ORF type:complete len:211 (+),score=21.00 TRINITY_DN11897_c0_g1_i1:73-705(+)